MWGLYDLVLRRVCGDGERMVGDDDGEGDNDERGESRMGRRRGRRASTQYLALDEKGMSGDHRV